MGNQRNALIEYTKVPVINRVRANGLLIIAADPDWYFRPERYPEEAVSPDLLEAEPEEPRSAA